MLQRFVSGCAVASVAIAGGALTILLAPGLTLQVVYPLPVAWCFVPLAWGIWAMLAPSSWLPQRLPIWGAFLGLIGGLIAIFVLDMPARLLGTSVPLALRGLGVVIIMAFYYLLWMLVRVVYRNLTTPAPQITSKAA